MKIVKGLAFFVVTVVFGSCFDPPQYPVVPEIEFEKIEFVPAQDPQKDTITVYVNFKDGDGDLGLDPENPEHFSYPYNDAIYYLASNGQLTPINTKSISGPIILDIPDESPGKLVFPRTRKKAGFGNLPAYQIPASCLAYNFTKILIDSKDLNAIKTDDLSKVDPYIKFTDTVNIAGTRYYEIEDTLYYSVNPDHYNIEVTFMVREPQHPEADADGYIVYDFRAIGCQQRGVLGETYNGRFITLSDRGGPLEGTLRYAMNNSAFTEAFSIKTLKLKVQIKDLALNKSNTITTPEFTLDKIRKR